MFPARKKVNLWEYHLDIVPAVYLCIFAVYLRDLHYICAFAVYLHCKFANLTVCFQSCSILWEYHLDVVPAEFNLSIDLEKSNDCKW